MGNVFLVDDCDGGELLEDQPALDDQVEGIHRVSTSQQGQENRNVFIAWGIGIRFF